MRFEAFIASRYLRGKRRTRFVGLITVISMAGVSVGVMTLIVVMSVMTGFDNALRATIIGNRAHLTIQDFRDTIDDYEGVIEQVKGIAPQVVACGPVIQAESLLMTHGRAGEIVTGGFVVGIDPEREKHVTDLPANLTREGGRQHGRGSLPEFKEIVLGYRLAHRLGAGIGEPVGVMTYREKVAPGAMRRGQVLWLTVSGISEARMSDFDSLYAFVDLRTARLLTGRDGVDAIHCKLTDPFLAEPVGRAIMREAGYDTQTWYEGQQEFFEALRQEKLVMFIILAFIVLVAAFNITSTLIMVVMEKRRDIGILRTLGVSGRSIMVLFVFEGLLIGLTGAIAGLVAGTLLAYNINPVAEFIAGLFNVDLFSSQIYYFDRIPSDVVWLDVMWVTVSAVALTFLSTLYPAWSASRLDPVDALRYE